MLGSFSSPAQCNIEAPTRIKYTITTFVYHRLSIPTLRNILCSSFAWKRSAARYTALITYLSLLFDFISTFYNLPPASGGPFKAFFRGYKHFALRIISKVACSCGLNCTFLLYKVLLPAVSISLLPQQDCYTYSSVIVISKINTKTSDHIPHIQLLLSKGTLYLSLQYTWP